MNFLSFFFKPKKSKPDLELLPEAVLVVSQTGEIIDYNGKALRLFDVSDFDNFDLLDLFDGGYTLVCDLSKTGSAVVVRSKIKIEEELFFEIKASLFDANDCEIIVSLRDVTSNQRMLNKLMFEHEYLNKLTKEKNTFITKISSELTSPLHSINGFSQAVLEGLGGDINEKQDKYLKIINKNSAQLLELIDKIVEYSKLESSIYDYEFKNFDFVTLITSIFNEYKPKAEEKKLILNVDLNRLAKRTCYNDESLVKKTMTYLIDSAIKSTDSGSVHIEISTPDLEFLEIAGFKTPQNANDKSFLMFKISDTSTGLIENEKDTIFNPYAEIDKAIAKKNLGKKLSMGIVYHMVKLAKGKIWVESEPLKGTSFIFVVSAEKLGA